MSKETVDVLQEALDRLGPNGEHWTKGASARNVSGAPVPAVSPEAVSWCAFGSVQACEVDPQLKQRVFDVLWKVLYRKSIIYYNDHKTFKHIEKMFKTAIQKELKR